MGKIEPVSPENIHAAEQRIRALVPETPVLESSFLETFVANPVFLKLENLNLSGSFKIRGAANALLSQEKSNLKKGVIAASAGNHAQGVAILAKQLGIPATIFMPERTPIIKAERTRDLGASVVLTGQNYDEAFQAALEEQKRSQALMIHPYSDPLVVCGQGTIGLELIKQVPKLGMVIIPIGGGGLVSGIACALKAIDPEVKIIGVQTEAYPAMKRSFDAGKIVEAPHTPTIADGIAVKSVNEFNLGLVRKYVDEIVLVNEEEIAWGVMSLMERNALLVEGCGGAAAAALRKVSPESLKACQGKAITCIITGGNIDVNLLNRITTKGLIKSGRLMRLRFTVEDRPGVLAELLEHVGAAGANLQHVEHDRTFASSAYHEVVIFADLETISESHQAEVKKSLAAAGFSFSVLT